MQQIVRSTFALDYQKQAFKNCSCLSTIVAHNFATTKCNKQLAGKCFCTVLIEIQASFI
jgi:hypothetical protein